MKLITLYFPLRVRGISVLFPLRGLGGYIILLFSLFLLLSFTHKQKPITIFMIGDSTMANKTTPGDHPLEHGWGMMLPEFFNSNVKVSNHAVNGRSTKSFRAEGRWAKVYEQIKPGDYVFIQFGHNDQKADTLLHTDPETSYPTNLARYVKETRERGGIPVLFTSIVRRTFNEDGTLRDTHGKYIHAVEKVAAELKVICIDLNAATGKLLLSMGDEPSKALYMWTEATTENPALEARKDNTHLNIRGAKTVAQIAVDSIRTKIPALRKYILKSI